MIKRKHFIPTILSVMLSVGMIGCAKQETAGEVKDALKLGIIQSTTGNGAAYGELHLKAIQLAIDEINKNGGVNGQPIQYIVGDEKSDAANGINSAKKLIQQEKVDAIIGSTSSLITIAFAKENESAKVPLLNGIAGSPKITELGNKYT
jgi:branched-chain amino acid transport system substrate-binding protein